MYLYLDLDLDLNLDLDFTWTKVLVLLSKHIVNVLVSKYIVNVLSQSLNKCSIELIRQAFRQHRQDSLTQSLRHRITLLINVAGTGQVWQAYKIVESYEKCVMGWNRVCRVPKK